MKKTILTFLFVLGLVVTTTAQNKIETTAQEKVDELNTELISVDPSLALTEAQKAQIFEIHVQRIKEARNVNKTEQDKEKIKELRKGVNKKYFQKIYKDVLTKEQSKARRELKKKK